MPAAGSANVSNDQQQNGQMNKFELVKLLATNWSNVQTRTGQMLGHKLVKRFTWNGQMDRRGKVVCADRWAVMDPRGAARTRVCVACARACVARARGMIGARCAGDVCVCVCACVRARVCVCACVRLCVYVCV